MENRFNLIEEPWIPIVCKELISFKQLCNAPANEYPEIGTNPVQKIALTKLLFAIAQAAYTPEDEKAWLDLGVEGLSKYCLDYLEKWYDRFWLYGERPFLQMPEIKNSTHQKLSAVLPDVASGNTSYFFQTQNEKILDDPDKAVLIVTLMGFALGGKKIDNSLVLTSGYKKKPTGRPGSSVGHLGYLHNFVLGSNVKETIWINLVTSNQIEKQKAWSSGLGTAPWEKMPKGEDCPIARELKESYMGRLVPLSRFCLLEEERLYYSEGISLSGHKEGGVDPSVAVDRSKNEWKAAWVDPSKRPWRMVPAFLSYMGKTKTNAFDCFYIQEGLARVKYLPKFSIWSGGLRVSSNAGEQYVSGSDDFVESKVLLSADIIGNENWFFQIEEEMRFLDELSKSVYSSVLGYYKQLKVEGSNHAGNAANMFWQMAEKSSQELFQNESPKNLRKNFKNLAIKVYDQLCPRETARQISSWVRNRSKFQNIGSYERPRNKKN